MKRILVTGAGGPAAFNFIYSLRATDESFYIVGTDLQPYHLELSDLDKRYIMPPATMDNYIEKLNRLISIEGIEFVHPQPDMEVAVLCEKRKDINAMTFLPHSATIEICQNKIALARLLNEKNIPAPQSVLITNRDDLKKSLDELLPRTNKSVWLRAIRGAGSKAALPVRKFDHGVAWIEFWGETHGVGWGDFMASEFLPGAEFAFQSIWQNGEIITSQARQRLEYMFGNLTVSGQTSTPSIARTVHRDDVNEIATKAILAVDKNATGVFCVDMKENIEGIPCVTEINAGRFFTTSNFFALAGSNMPYYYLKLAYGEKLPQLPKYNAIPKDLYWVRKPDMGFKLVGENEWKSIKL